MSIVPNSFKAVATILSLFMVATGTGPVILESASAQEHSGESQVEVGKVAWSTDWSAATKGSRADGKPLFVQFQEIPGCQTCQNYGKRVLTHPLMVEAIEDNFHPLLVYNNRQGEDATILKKFGEPSWNNPVVRLLDAEQKDLIPRQDRVWTRGGISALMTQALKAAKRPVPKYLAMLAAEESSREKATFAMYCYWSGEAKLGRLPGVFTTSAGWMEGLEVVELEYDPKRISYDRLVKEASSMECASRVFTHGQQQHDAAIALLGKNLTRPAGKSRPAKDSDRKYFLKKSSLRYLPLTSVQATKVNAALGNKEDWQTWLSPRQIKLAAKVSNFLKEHPQGLRDFAPTHEPEELADYQSRLERFLEEKLATSAR